MKAKQFQNGLREINEATAVVPLRSAVMRVLALLGLQKAFFLAPLTGDPRIGRILTNIGFSTVWERQYRARLHLVDPLPDVSLRKTGAFLWPDHIDAGALNEKHKRYLDIAARYGLGRGIGVACYGPHGRAGFMAAAVPEGMDLDEDNVCPRFHTVGQLSFQRYCSLIRKGEGMPPLSNRELEVLQWIVFGKSNSVIAELLGISSSSVDAYVRRIFTKLNVADRTTASIKAFSLGLVVSSDHRDLVRDAASREPDGGSRRA